MLNSVHATYPFLRTTMLKILVFLGALHIFVVSALYGSNSSVQRLDAGSFHTKVKQGNDLWLVEFYAPWCGHCKAFAPEFERAAKALKGVINVAAVDDENLMAVENVSGFPTVKFYAGKLSTPSVFKGQRTAEDVVNFAMRETTAALKARLGGKKGKSSQNSKSGEPRKEGSVVVLTDSNFDEALKKQKSSLWFIEFYAPWCGHCKALESTWSDLAVALEGKAVVAKVDATENRELAQRFKIRGFPTIKLFPAGKHGDKDAIDYNGGREMEDLMDFATGYLAVSTNVEQLLDEAQFRRVCEKNVCLIAFLPHISDSSVEKRKEYLTELKTAARTSVRWPLNFFWVQGGDNFDLEEALHLQFGYPAFIAIRLDKDKFAVHKGSFEKDSLKSFLSGLMSGREKLQNLPKTLPQFKKTAPWRETTETVPSPEKPDEKGSKERDEL